MAYPIAFQLYSSRLFPPVVDHLPELKAMGYDAIEPWPPAYEDDPAEFRRRLDDAGLACFGFHMPLAGLVSEPNRYIEIAQTLGARYMIPPFVPEEERENTARFWQKIGGDLAAGAAKAAPHGLRVAWHNHDFEYVALEDGTRPIDHLLEAAGETVAFEIDCGWIRRAGADPATELARYAGRIAAIQTKDMAPPGTIEDDGWAATGDGIIDWPSLIPLFRETTADHIVTEHDNPSDWRRFAERSIRYLREIGV
ncbi:MAG: sugar phosphate isomerase/epimerase [Hyphomicrobiales bacterium]|nr:sugar phosphate isomerase/epimerase [Hyphomicrobiales bacterium]